MGKRFSRFRTIRAACAAVVATAMMNAALFNDRAQAAGGVNITKGTMRTVSPARHIPPKIVVPPKASALGRGYNTNCAIVKGGVQCWGWNAYGQVGDGSATDRSSPAQVQGLPSGSGVTALNNYIWHVCAVVNGSAKCWGQGTAGKLGNGSTANSNVPVQVSGFTSGVKSIATSYVHSCAVKSDGTVWCWGDNGCPGCANFQGWLGCGPAVSTSAVPVQVKGIGGSGVLTVDPNASITMGAYHTCILSAGAVYCWGSNGYGELGVASPAQSPYPVQPYTSGVTAVAGGDRHTCYIVGGAVKCSGLNQLGELGNGTTTNSNTPVQVTGLTSGATSIGAGAWHSCAVVNGNAWCWGHGSYGQLGNGANSQSSVPVQVKDAAGTGFLADVKEIYAAGYLSCALMTAGNVYCWGDNGYGALGLGTASGTYNLPRLAGPFLQ